MRKTEIAALAAMSSPGPLFAASPFVIKGSYVQINPCDVRCQAGPSSALPLRTNSHRFPAQPNRHRQPSDQHRVRKPLQRSSALFR